MMNRKSAAMRTRRVVTGLTAVVTAVTSLTLASSGPAAAADGSWRAYGNTNPVTSSPSHWTCSGTREIADNVLAQACVVRTPNYESAQTAVIVRNNRSNLFGVYADAWLWRNSDNYPLGNWYCNSSGVAAHSWSVCFGQTRPQPSTVYVDEAEVNRVFLDRTPSA